MSAVALSKLAEAIVTRHPQNPILTGADLPPEARIIRVFNSGIIKIDGRYIMACRVEDRALRNYFWIATRPPRVTAAA